MKVIEIHELVKEIPTLISKENAKKVAIEFTKLHLTKALKMQVKKLNFKREIIC